MLIVQLGGVAAGIMAKMIGSVLTVTGGTEAVVDSVAEALGGTETVVDSVTEALSGTEALMESVTEAMGATEALTEAATEEVLESVTEASTEVSVLSEIYGGQVAEAISNPGIIAEWWSNTYPTIIAFLIQVLLAAVTAIIGIRVIHALLKVINRSFEKADMDKSVASFLHSLIKYTLYFILIMLVLSGFGVAASSVVTLLGSAGLTIGLGLQGGITNLVGGILILALKPFEIGEYIQAGTDEGTVDEITIFYTHLLTIDNKRIVIPNGTLSDTTITNFTRMEKRRIDLKIGITYESDLRLAKDIVNRIVMEHPSTLKDEDIKVVISALEDSSVTVELRVWVKNEDYWVTRWDLIEKIKLAFDEEGVVIAYPHMTVDMMEK